MRSCVCLCLLSTSLCSVAFAVDDGAPSILDDAQLLTLEYWKWTRNDTVSYWDVAFSGEEIRTLEALLDRAKPYQPKGGVWLITSFDGELRTSQQTFKISIGEEKRAGRPWLFILTDKKNPKSKQIYQLVDEDAHDFTEILLEAMESKIRTVEPDRVRKRAL